jgi:hypothetical protein
LNHEFYGSEEIMKLVSEQLLKDMVLGIDLALEKIPDECDCQAYTESDTNATIHEEQVCQVFTRYHLEAVKSDIEKILSAVEHSVQRTVGDVAPCGCHGDVMCAQHAEWFSDPHRR